MTIYFKKALRLLFLIPCLFLFTMGVSFASGHKDAARTIQFDIQNNSSHTIAVATATFSYGNRSFSGTRHDICAYHVSGVLFNQKKLFLLIKPHNSIQSSYRVSNSGYCKGTYTLPNSEIFKFYLVGLVSNQHPLVVIGEEHATYNYISNNNTFSQFQVEDSPYFTVQAHSFFGGSGTNESITVNN